MDELLAADDAYLKDDANLRIGEPETAAVGVPGVAVSMRYALSEMGTARSVRTLLRVNQADGFDCPSCAWADPSVKDRKHAEFCENGAKAVAWEATRKRADAAFFAAHPIAFLREQSDQLRAHRARRDQAEPVAPAYRPRGARAALPGQDGTGTSAAAPSSTSPSRTR